MSETILRGHDPAAIEAVILHHDKYYRERWDFDDRFEAQVRGELTAFVERLDPVRDNFWWAEKDDEFVGAIVVDGTVSGPDEARLRWFIVPESFQGIGVGSLLFGAALDFCRAKGFPKVYLWTFKGLGAARTLYERNGFRLTEEAFHDGWGPEITAQKFELDLS